MLNKATQAREDTIIGQEKEAISIAWNSLMTDKIIKGIEIKDDNFEDELNRNGDRTKVNYEDDDESKNFLVNFRNTNHEYIVDRNGNIILKGINAIEDEFPMLLSSIKSWTVDANSDFHKQNIRNLITDIEFVNYIPNPINLNDSNCWDVSQEENQSIIAWIEDIENSEYKKLYIGGKNGVKANEDSSHIFYNFTNLKSVNFGKYYNTSNVTNMRGMFYNCLNLTELDLSNFNTSKVENMVAMFELCKKLTSLNLSNFNTSKVKDMAAMFESCEELTSLNLSNFNTSQCNNMNDMFSKCKKLKNINLSSFDTRNVTNIRGMFYECSDITELDLSNFNTSSVENMHRLFSNDSKLVKIYVSGLWNVDLVNDSEYMFTSCSNVYGGNGTKFDSRYTDKTFAKIDTNSSTGYLTYRGPYNKLSYIESTGNQYFILDNISTNSFGFDIELYIKENTGANIFGGFRKGTNNFCYMGTRNQKVSYYPNENAIDFCGINYNEKHSYKLINSKYYYDNNLIGTMEYTNNESNLAVFSFVDSNGIVRSTQTETFNGRIYKFIIYDGETVICNLVPCYIEVNGEIGMYDTISNRFYCSMGSEKFITNNNTN